MIRANISEIKNRLSHYLRLVKGGEQVEILDRNTPLARIIHVSQAETKDDASWINEVVNVGIVTPPKKRGLPKELLSGVTLSAKGRKSGTGVLKALLEEREDGR